jgi:hypothetical protein
MMREKNVFFTGAEAQTIEKVPKGTLFKSLLSFIAA